MFEYQEQPFDNVCGQAVVAMVIGEPVSYVISKMRIKKTTPADLQAILTQHNWRMDLTAERLPETPAGPAVMFGQTIHRNKLFRHWALWTGRVFFDPAAPGRTTFEDSWTGRFYALQKIKSS